VLHFLPNPFIEPRSAGGRLGDYVTATQNLFALRPRQGDMNGEALGYFVLVQIFTGKNKMAQTITATAGISATGS
jgi:hypothetical protein